MHVLAINYITRPCNFKKEKTTIAAIVVIGKLSIDSLHITHYHPHLKVEFRAYMSFTYEISDNTFLRRVDIVWNFCILFACFFS